MNWENALMASLYGVGIALVVGLLMLWIFGRDPVADFDE